MGELDADVSEHLAWCRDLRGLTEATIRARRWVLNRLSSCIDRPLRDAEIGHVMLWEQTCVAGLAAQSRRAYIGHVHAFYKWALARGIITENPAGMLTRPKVPKPLPRPIVEDDLAQALSAASPKLAAMMTLMADCGLRCMEVAGLTWSDISTADGQAWLAVRNGKGRKDRLVPLGETTLRALRRHGTKLRGPVFLGREGRQMQPHSVSQIVNDHLRRLAIPATAHKLRARYATQASAVLDTPTVAELCGWESLDTARHYVKPDRERAARLTAALDQLAADTRSPKSPTTARAPGGNTTPGRTPS